MKSDVDSILDHLIEEHGEGAVQTAFERKQAKARWIEAEHFKPSGKSPRASYLRDIDISIEIEFVACCLDRQRSHDRLLQHLNSRLRATRQPIKYMFGLMAGLATHVGREFKRLPNDIQRDRSSSRRAKRKNPILEAFVNDETNKTRTPSQIVARLELMTKAKLRRAIGQDEAPSIRTVGRYKKVGT